VKGLNFIVCGWEGNVHSKLHCGHGLGTVFADGIVPFGKGETLGLSRIRVIHGKGDEDNVVLVLTTAAAAADGTPRAMIQRHHDCVADIDDPEVDERVDSIFVVCTCVELSLLHVQVGQIPLDKE
jgi:hypothetical protein